MLPNGRAQPAAREKPSWGSRVLRRVGKAPFYVKLIVLVAAVFASPFILLYVLASAVIDVVQKRPGRLAAYAVAAWAIPIDIFSQVPRLHMLPLLVLPFVVAWAAGTGPLARWYLPCRTTAWAMLWSLPIGIVLLRSWRSEPLVGVVAAVLVAFAVVGWRLAKGMQDSRLYPAGMAPPESPGRPGPGQAGPGPHQGYAAPGRPHPAAQPGYGIRAEAAALPYAEHAARDHQGGSGPLRPRPQISVEDAMAELDAMIGLASVKEQVRSIAASIEAARRRTVAGITTERPMRHFVFLGPPGTGKTTVARVLAKIFYAFGLLQMPEVIEAHRADLVGEYLGATAIKTNELVDSALGGVLFIDEAYSLVNEGDGQADRFGVEAVQALLKRAEDNRENLIIILAGYEKQMETFLASNPGLASRFATRLKFPSYSPPEMMALAEAALDRRGEVLDPDARPVLWRTSRGGRPPPDDRRPRQRPVRPQPAREGRPGPRRAGDDRHGRARGQGPGDDPRPRHGAGLRRADQPPSRLRGHAHRGGRDRRARRTSRPGAGEAAGAIDRRAVARGQAA